jgi:hypothetical protein
MGAPPILKHENTKVRKHEKKQESGRVTDFVFSFFRVFVIQFRPSGVNPFVDPINRSGVTLEPVSQSAGRGRREYS